MEIELVKRPIPERLELLADQLHKVAEDEEVIISRYSYLTLLGIQVSLFIIAQELKGNE